MRALLQVDLASPVASAILSGNRVEIPKRHLLGEAQRTMHEARFLFGCALDKPRRSCTIGLMNSTRTSLQRFASTFIRGAKERSRMTPRAGYKAERIERA